MSCMLHMLRSSTSRNDIRNEMFLLWQSISPGTPYLQSPARMHKYTF